MEIKPRVTEADLINEIRDRMFNRAYEYREKLECNFSYHAPKPGQPEKYQELRQMGKDLAYLMEYHCPKSRELSIAMTKLEECIMWANASIAREAT